MEMELENPDRHDQYLMQIAAVVAMANAKDPLRVSLKQFRLRFDGKDRPVDPKAASVISKMGWFAATGVKGSVTDGGG
jgi:hypothetical protein